MGIIGRVLFGTKRVFVATCIRTSVLVHQKYLPDEDKANFVDGICPKTLPLAGSPLHIAVSIRDEGLIRYLLMKGIPTCRLNLHLRSPLHKAIFEGFESGARALLESGATVNEIDRYGTPLLHCAAQRSSRQLFSMILKQGANLGQRDQNGDCVKVFAQKLGREDIIAEIDAFLCRIELPENDV